jgi:hypothetical protein
VCNASVAKAVKVSSVLWCVFRYESIFIQMGVILTSVLPHLADRIFCTSVISALKLVTDITKLSMNSLAKYPHFKRSNIIPATACSYVSGETRGPHFCIHRSPLFGVWWPGGRRSDYDTEGCCNDFTCHSLLIWTLLLMRYLPLCGLSALLRICAAMEAQHDASSVWHACFEGTDFICVRWTSTLLTRVIFP